MSALGLGVAFAILVAIAILGPIFGVDSRPGVKEPPDLFFRHRS